MHVIFFTLTLPNGASDLILGVIMAAMLLFRPSGITGGAEFSLAFLKRLRRVSRTGSAPAGKQEDAPAPPLEEVKSS